VARGKLAAATSLPEDTVRVSKLCDMVYTNHKEEEFVLARAMGSGEVEREVRRWQQTCLEQKSGMKPYFP
jgi:hypothetical protein